MGRQQLIKIRFEMKTTVISNIASMEDLLKKAMAGVDKEEIVPKHAKRT